ncbi:MAG: hypothetical protein HN352_02330 [Bacteroidetes bacterium]|jgi:hypothetical protein|nr:hypothetical protein [Bacteroidota bacterium]MBT3749925.1 hypothetical protein [Bacteroidota bacterium]MBT4401146.1 hypothetical protein [Bacteroidota bacterium]MBT4411218.1 hypothetical protein [Bacteroidota bacterium]MBT5425833.1 hypothetical protein [Bacteroidota bacterium]
MQIKSRGWKICIIIFVILTIVSFTPLIIPQGIYKPEILGIPYSLWSGFFITLALVILTFAGTRMHPGGEEKKTGK